MISVDTLSTSFIENQVSRIYYLYCIRLEGSVKKPISLHIGMLYDAEETETYTRIVVKC